MAEFPENCKGAYLQKPLLRELIDNGTISRERALDQLYGHREDGGALTAGDCYGVAVYLLRKKLKPGWEIVCPRRNYMSLVYAGEDLTEGAKLKRALDKL